MAEAIGVAAGAIAFVQATSVVLNAISKIRNAPQYIQGVQSELSELEGLLRQVDAFSCQKGDPAETALRSCSEALKRLHDLVVPLQQEVSNKKFMQYIKGFRMRQKESEIEDAVKRLESRKVNLVIALAASKSRSDPLSSPQK
jgi:N-terminal domain on NACHT_NTPase and P-loop NTPases